MKVRALADISGPMGRKAVGEEFVVGAAEGKELVDRKLVEAVDEAPAKPAKEPKAEA
ncbi:hypothetical protein ACIQAL_13330 [Pseudomonas sp. NPDC088368]|uniref:hypothetical protein n=1 Tax=Pseudomonas sp. NPDC088368 TaxID=3364453 RepID=UPI00382BF5E9